MIPTSNHNWVESKRSVNLLYIFWFLHQTTTMTLLLFTFTELYIFWFLHQTTTGNTPKDTLGCCISFDSYIKPQLWPACNLTGISCISFDSYIKPQLLWVYCLIFFCCISFDSYIKPQLAAITIGISSVVYLLIPTSNHNLWCYSNFRGSVVYLLIPTSNHNCELLDCSLLWLYIFWFLHQTTTHS